MKIKVRQLNAFANVQKSIERTALAKDLHATVLAAVENGVDEIDLPTDTADERKLVQLIVQSDVFIPVLNRETQRLKRFI
ncbi:hypothetical protein DRH27_06240 [Candidatus Falkowbacteria bacterium]|nr:MAG: hypothetical protein DRH27_06240 [Candidatus Falkowbacteria bacterium]